MEGLGQVRWPHLTLKPYKKKQKTKTKTQIWFQTRPTRKIKFEQTEETSKKTKEMCNTKRGKMFETLANNKK